MGDRNGCKDREKQRRQVKYGRSIGDRPGSRGTNDPEHGWDRWGIEIEK